MTGRIVLLNGAPRSGKTSIARAMQAKGPWMIFGVDAMMAMTPPSLLPGIGLRPGGERPELESFVQASYAALFNALAGFAARGLDVVSDVGIHEAYSRPLNIASLSSQLLSGFRKVWVRVDCPLATIMMRRNAEPDSSYEKGAHVPPPVVRWQEAVHDGKQYDIFVDTSLATPEACADRILGILDKA